MKYSPHKLTFICLVLTLLPWVASCVISPPPGSPETGYTITGFIAKSPEVAAQNEKVYLFDGRTDKLITSVATNFFGKYTFSGLRPALYIVQVRDKKWGVLIEDRSERLDIDLSAPDGTMDYLGHHVKKAFPENGGTQKSAAGSADTAPFQARSGDGSWPPPCSRKRRCRRLPTVRQYWLHQ